MTARTVASLGAALALLLIAAVPGLAHDDVTGTPDVTITVGQGLSDRDVRVDAGAIVRFVNRDDERHRMRSRRGDRGFDTGNIEPGEWAQVRLSTAGTYTYLDDRERDDSRYHGRIVVGNSGGNGGGGASTVGTPASAAAVTIGDRVFQPASTTIAVGGTVAFRNGDGDEHTVTSSGGGGIDSGTLASGGTYKKRFSEAGSYDFLCVFHPDMQGTIDVVEATPDTAPAAPAAPKPTTTPTHTPTPPSVTAPNTEPIDIVDLAFDPATVELPAGTTVLWSNTGVAPHTVSAEAGSFDSGTLESGASFEHTFAKPGTYAYLCRIHPAMTGTIEIVASDPEPAAAAATAAGSTTPATNGTVTLDTNPTGSALPGIALSVTLVGVATALFARLLRGVANRR
jgi:plastocyanin